MHGALDGAPRVGGVEGRPRGQGDVDVLDVDAQRAAERVDLESEPPHGRRHGLVRQQKRAELLRLQVEVLERDGAAEAHVDLRAVEAPEPAAAEALHEPFYELREHS